MVFIDTHSHIADEAYSGEEDAVIERALQKGVCKMLQADIDSKERDAMLAAVDRHPGVLYPMLGLYPGSVDKNWREEVDKVIDLSRSDRKFVAIGEIGLDYHYGAETKAEQKDAFAAQLELAARLDLPVNIHLREATEDFFSIMDSVKGLGLRGNLHAFSGSSETAARLRRYGDWSVGIGGVLTFKKASIAVDLKDIPMEMILLETDAPYLAPTPLRGTRNESSNIPIIAAMVASIKELSLEKVAEITTSNAYRLFTRIAD